MGPSGERAFGVTTGQGSIRPSSLRTGSSVLIGPSYFLSSASRLHVFCFLPGLKPTVFLQDLFFRFWCSRRCCRGDLMIRAARLVVNRILSFFSQKGEAGGGSSGVRAERRV